MPGDDTPVTLLHALKQRQHLTWEELAQKVRDAAQQEEGVTISLTYRHIRRLALRENGSVTPYPVTCRALQNAFGHNVVDLLAPYHDPRATALTTHGADSVESDSFAHQEVLTLAADRAKKFAINLPGMADIGVDQIADGVRDLALAYPAQPLPFILNQLVTTQDEIFGLLEQPQRPSHGRQLYFLAGVTSGMLAKASHDLADPQAALAQSRTAWLCAEQADHRGLRGWISGLQSLISYWAGRPTEAVRYAQRGAEYATNSTSVWLPANEARAWARLGRHEEAKSAIQRAEDAWSNVRPDELDELGGIAAFSEARALYYAADALAWLPNEHQSAEQYASRAVEAYSNPAAEHYAFGDQAGSHCDLAIARIHRGEIDGAIEAARPVLDLPADQRIGGIIKSVRNVQEALARSPHTDQTADFQESIEAFTRTPLRMLPA